MLAFIRSSYFQGLLDSFQNGVILFNDAGRAYAANAAMPRLLGLAPEDCARTTWEEFFARLGLDEPLERVLELARPLEDQGVLDGRASLPGLDFDYAHPDGRRLRLSLSRSVLVDYGKLFGITVQIADMTDLTALHEREKGMIEENRRLQLQRARGLLKLSMGVAHQIRNPLMTVGGFSELLLRRLPANGPESGFVAPILDSARRMEAIVNAVSAYAALRLGDVRAVDLRAEAGSALREACAGPGTCGAELSVEDGAGAFEADPDLLRRALAECFRNSLEAAGGPCRIVVAARPESGADGDSVVLSVSDDGPGLAAEHLPFAFDPFYSTKPLSVGMGLTTVERIAQEHGGRAELAPGRPGGLTVVLRLPRRPGAGFLPLDPAGLIH